MRGIAALEVKHHSTELPLRTLKRPSQFVLKKRAVQRGNHLVGIT